MRINTLFNRRTLLAMMAGLFLATSPALAQSKAQAEKLINALTQDIFKSINSGKSEASLFRDFEKIFVKYADVPVIARSSLGVARRSASNSEMRAYTKAFQGYVSRKYGKRFREFIGATIEVTKSRKTQRGYLVTSQVTFKGKKPFVVEWQVSNASGRDKMFDIIIEGISMLKLEREEIGQLLDRRGGDMGKLIAYLKTAS